MKQILTLLILPFLLSSCNKPEEVKDPIVDFSYLETCNHYNQKIGQGESKYFELDYYNEKVSYGEEISEIDSFEVIDFTEYSKNKEFISITNDKEYFADLVNGCITITCIKEFKDPIKLSSFSIKANNKIFIFPLDITLSFNTDYVLYDEFPPTYKLFGNIKDIKDLYYTNFGIVYTINLDFYVKHDRNSFMIRNIRIGDVEGLKINEFNMVIVIHILKLLQVVLKM